MKGPSIPHLVQRGRLSLVLSCHSGVCCSQGVQPVSVDARGAWAAVTVTSGCGSFLGGLGSSGLRMVTWSHGLHTWSSPGGSPWPKAWQEMPSSWQSLPDPAQSICVAPGSQPPHIDILPNP